MKMTDLRVMMMLVDFIFWGSIKNYSDRIRRSSRALTWERRVVLQSLDTILKDLKLMIEVWNGNVKSKVGWCLFYKECQFFGLKLSLAKVNDAQTDQNDVIQ